MPHFYKLIACILILPASITSIAHAATYPAPELSKLMFHLDKIPLDQDRIRLLSNDLAVLAQKKTNGEQARLTTNAKLLTLAIRLNAKNENATRLNQRFMDGNSVQNSNFENENQARKRTKLLIKALSKAEQHSEAHRLNSYLKDALKGVDPNDPDFNDEENDPKLWLNVLPKIKPKKEPVIEQDYNDDPPEKMDKDDSGDNAPENKDPVEDPVKDEKTNKWHQLVSEIYQPVYFHKRVNDNSTYTIKHAKFKTTIKPHDGNDTGNITLRIDPSIQDSDSHKTEQRLNKFLKNKWGNFPNASLTLKLPGSYNKYAGDLGFLPLAFQLHASLKNIEINKGIGLLGSLDEQGNLTRNNYLFWRQLKELRKHRTYKQTLIAPVGTEQDFLQIVALEEAEFFIRNEVVLVENIDQAVQYAGELKDENLKAAHEEFVKIRDLVGSRSVGSFSVNKKVRKMLETILTLNPNHISARMILIRGDTKRSGRLSSYYVAEEFKYLFRDLKYIVEKDSTALDSQDMSNRATQIDEAIQPIKRYIDSKDKVMLSALEKMSSELNIISRSRKRDGSSDYHKRSARIAHERFIEQYETALEFIKEAQKEEE